MSRPVPERPGDSLPTPDDFAGWPALGARSLRAHAGPVSFELERVDSRVAEALADFETKAGADAGSPGLATRLQWTRAQRGPWLGAIPGDRARSVAWTEGGALAWATHHAALLMDVASGQGIVVLTDQDAAETARSAQNVLRVATAWRLAATATGLLVHASAVRDGDGAVVFLGPSGAGKSTAARLSAPRPVLADDACILTADGKALLHPAPFWAEPGIERRRDEAGPVAVASVLRLRQGTPHELRGMGRPAATAALLAHAPFLDAPGSFASRDLIAERIASAARFEELRFGADAGFWSLLGREHGSRAFDARQGSVE